MKNRGSKKGTNLDLRETRSSLQILMLLLAHVTGVVTLSACGRRWAGTGRGLKARCPCLCEFIQQVVQC